MEFLFFVALLAIVGWVVGSLTNKDRPVAGESYVSPLSSGNGAVSPGSQASLCALCGSKNCASAIFCYFCGSRCFCPQFGRGWGRFSAEVAFFYRWYAAWEASNLPDTVSFLLMLAWSQDERGDSIHAATADEAIRNVGKFILDARDGIEAAERQSGLNDVGDTRELAWALLQDPRATMATAVEAVVSARVRGLRTIAGEEELHSAHLRFRDVIYRWLDSVGLFYSKKESVTIPAITLVRLLQKFAGHADIYFDPNIPAEKLENVAGISTPLHDEKDSIVALIDCTVFGSAKDYIVMTSKSIYFQNQGVLGFLPYSEFPDRAFRPGEKPQMLSIGSGQWINLSGSQVAPLELMEMLNILKNESRRLQTQRTDDTEGLRALPGLKELKQMLLEEVVAPLRNPEQFRKYKIDIPNGILLYGPPGCGKTFAARRLANELNYHFVEISPSAIGSPYIHTAGLNIAAVFRDAEKHSPALIFVDEFDGLVPARSSLDCHAEYKAEEVNEWLTQISSCAERGILFVAATNEPWKIDEAVRRTGRLDKKIYVGPPDREGLVEILCHHLKGRPITSERDIFEFASTIAGKGYSGSDIKALTDEAAKFAMKENTHIGYRHLCCAAAEKVSPSITLQQEERYLSFGNQSRRRREFREEMVSAGSA